MAADLCSRWGCGRRHGRPGPRWPPPGWRSVAPGSVPEVQAVETRAFKPAMAPAGQVHREIDMSAQGLKAGVVEPPDRTHVAGYRPDRQVLMAASDGLSSYPFDKKPPDAPVTQTTSDDDRFDLAAGAAIEQARKTDNPAIEIGHPGRYPFWHGEIIVERTPGIVASDGRVFVYPPVMLSQFRPQHPAGGIVRRRVVADNNAGRGSEPVSSPLSMATDCQFCAPGAAHFRMAAVEPIGGYFAW